MGEGGGGGGGVALEVGGDPISVHTVERNSGVGIINLSFRPQGRSK